MDSIAPPRLRPADVARALARNEIGLVYQPKVALADRRIIGVEALARWRHPVRGPIPPDAFIPAAERGAVIDRLTCDLLGVALSQWAAWRDHGLELEIGFNISARNLQHVDFPDAIDAACRAHDVDGGFLTVELTESATQQAVQLMDTMTRLRIKGIRISLDDFGIGYSSLVQLRRLPFNEIKIDKSFVMELPASRDCRVIVKSIIDLAHNLGLEVTAEGVETAEALRFLVDHGCDKAQGYHFARPMAGAALPVWIRSWGWRHNVRGLGAAGFGIVAPA